MRIAAPIGIFGAVMLTAILAPATGLARAAFPPGAAPRVQAPQQHNPAVEKVGKTTIDFGNLATQFGTGYTLIDSNTVTCAKPTCTVVFDMEEQVGNQTTASNWFAVCALLDGNFGPFGCPYAGEVPTDGGYIDSRTRQTFTGVTRGTHTVQVELYLSTAPAYSDAFDIQYDVLTP